MLNICISSSFYAILISIGYMLSILNGDAYFILPFFALFLLIFKPLFIANCKPIEWKDFLVSALFTAFIILFYNLLSISFALLHLVYWYTITFIALICYTSSLRYKSLIH